MLTTSARSRTVVVVQASQRSFLDDLDTLVTNVRDILDSADARDRVRAVRLLGAGIKNLERRVLLDAQSAGMSWAEIGNVYGVSRQAAHRRFADETVVSSEDFDTLLKELDEPPEVIPALARVAGRARHHRATG